MHDVSKELCQQFSICPGSGVCRLFSSIWGPLQCFAHRRKFDGGLSRTHEAMESLSSAKVNTLKFSHGMAACLGEHPPKRQGRSASARKVNTLGTWAL